MHLLKQLCAIVFVFNEKVNKKALIIKVKEAPQAS